MDIKLRITLIIKTSWDINKWTEYKSLRYPELILIDKIKVNTVPSGVRNVVDVALCLHRNSMLLQLNFTNSLTII